MVASGLRSSCPASATKARREASARRSRSSTRLSVSASLASSSRPVGTSRIGAGRDPAMLSTWSRIRSTGRSACPIAKVVTAASRATSPTAPMSANSVDAAQRGRLDLGRHGDEHRVAAPVEAGRVGGRDREARPPARARVDVVTRSSPGGRHGVGHRRHHRAVGRDDHRPGVVDDLGDPVADVDLVGRHEVVDGVQRRSVRSSAPPTPRCPARTPRAPGRARGR